MSHLTQVLCFLLGMFFPAGKAPDHTDQLTCSQHSPYPAPGGGHGLTLGEAQVWYGAGSGGELFVK